MKKALSFIALVSVSLSSFAQQPTTTTAPPPTTTTTAPPTSTTGSSVLGPTVNNGVYVPEHLPNRKPIIYTPLREADVMWQRRIWRVIDLREKINHPLYYPIDEVAKRPSFFDIIKKGIISQELSVYDPNPSVFVADEEFSIEWPYAQAQKAFLFEQQIMVQDTSTGELIPTSKPDTFKSDDIVQYRIKEDWFFDKQRSVMDVRILGLAPVVETQDDKGEFKGYKTLFWLYYPACRNYFARFQCYNPYNDAEWRTFDEVLHKRLFSSYIIQESNVYNRPIATYANGVEFLLETDRIKDVIFKFEHDMWHF